jgi:hypothetical protein
MTSELKVDKITPASGTNTQIGEAGDTTNLSAGTVTLPTSIITGASEKTTLVDADKFLIADSADSNAFKHVQKSNLPSGGLVLVGSITDDSGSSVITLDNIFSATYKSYLIQVTRLVPSSSGPNIEFLFRDSSSADLSANYGFASRTLKANDGSESTRNGDGQSYVTITTAGIGGVNNNTTGQGLRMSLFVADPYASEQTGYHGNFSNLDNGGYGIAGYLGGIHQANSSVRGFKLRPSTGTIAKATIRVYGLVSS